MLFLVLLLLISTQHLSPSGAMDTLALGQSLPWNETLVSNGGTFELGLLSPGKSGKHYVGIWYKKIPKRTVVWVANRVNPIVNPSTTRFMLSIHGELLLLTLPSDTLLWASNASSPGTSTVATLQDDGNLVVRRGNGTSVSWQSFDHPTDTWLPGARLGYDKAGGVHSFLTSWTDSENPAPGAFSMEIDSRGLPKLDLFANAAHRYWTTGMWDGEIFANLPEMRSSGYFAWTPYAPNASVNFFSYHDRAKSVGNFVLDVNGQMRWRQWNESSGDWIVFFSEPRDTCDVYDSCGSFGTCSNTTSPACQCPAGFSPRSEQEWELGNTASGCERQSPLDCPKDAFLALPYAVQLPNNGSAEAAGVGNERDCERSCLKDCSCTAYAYSGTKCSLWKDQLVNTRRMLPSEQGDGDLAVAGVVLHLRVARSEVIVTSLSTVQKKSMVIIGSVIAVVVVLLGCLVIVGTVVLWKQRRGRGKVTAAPASLLLLDFSEKLGSASTAYKGTFHDATVKKLDGLRQGEK